MYYGVNEAATSATEGEDYTLPEMNYITFSRSKATAQVTIPIINDEIVEGDETLGLILLSSDHPDIEYLHMGGAETITIRDNDLVTVDFIGPDSYTVNEGDGSVAVTFGITAGTLAANASVAVSYATSADTAFEADDYTPVAGTVILTADNPEVTVWIPIIDDAVLEGDEEFGFTITPGGNAIAGDTSAEITITDDDPPLGTIGFPNEPGAIEEVWENDGSGLIRISVQTSPSLSDTFTLNYEIEPGTTASTAASTATSEDYMDTVLEGVLRLEPNTSFHQISIRLNDDSIAEGAESLVIRLVIPDGTTLPTGFSLTNATQEVIILDDDSTLVGFGIDLMETELESYVHKLGGVALGVGLGALTSQEGEIGHTITLNYVVEDGSAIRARIMGRFSVRDGYLILMRTAIGSLMLTAARFL